MEDNKYLYEYDLVGNRTKRTDKSTNEVMEYRWDIRDRLTGITVKNAFGEIIRTAEYTYDVYNQRIAKTVDTDGDGSLAAVTERFVYGSDQNIALVFDENRNVNHRYLFGNGVDQIEADESNGNVRWALTDHLGSVRDVVDDSGTVLNHIVYDAFAGVTSQTNESVVFRFGYTARELDTESGLQYNRARYLDSFTGKFISKDPISLKGGDANIYRYVFNSPTNSTDPSGNIAPRSNGGSLSDNARSPRNIQAVFDYRSAILTLKDRETSETLQIQAFSGGGSEERFRKNGKKGTVHAILDTGYVNRRDLTHIRDFGGVPPRVYDILEFAIDPDYGYRLDRHDSIPRDDIDQYNGRLALVS